MDLVINQSCPSCGAPIILHETDRLIGCPYCEVKNYMVGGGSARFSLPDKLPGHVAREDLVYVPYMRFKGSVYYCQGHEVKHTVIDTTRLAIVADRLPTSLGLRPQAMKVVPVNAGHVGHFIRQTVKPEAIFNQAIKLTTLFASEHKQELHHRAVIGETLSRIYLPVYLQDDTLFDAVTNLEIGRVGPSWSALLAQTIVFQHVWEPRFLTTLCPRCAAPSTARTASQCGKRAMGNLCPLNGKASQERRKWTLPFLFGKFPLEVSMAGIYAVLPIFFDSQINRFWSERNMKPCLSLSGFLHSSCHRLFFCSPPTI